jgi:RNA polymerase sigma-70 factor (ECF subfamily)
MHVDEPSPVSVFRTLHEAALSKMESLNDKVTSLYEAHREKIYRFLLTQGLPAATAQEVTQDVFVELFIALRRGTRIISDQGWLYSVAAKSAVDFWRREGKALWVELDAEESKLDIASELYLSPECQIEKAQRLGRVASELLKLPREQRLSIQLRFEGLRYREIATVMGVAVSTASEWVSIAVRRLRGVARD